MKIVFRKDADQNISVLEQIDGKEREFSYVDMISYLINHGDLVAPELEGEFTDAEKDSVNSMVTLINGEVKDLKDQWAEEE